MPNRQAVSRPAATAPDPSPAAPSRSGDGGASGAFTPEWLEAHRVDASSLQVDEVVGIGHVLVEVESVAARLRDPERAAAFGLVPPRGILFWGAPGLGKTLVARWLARRLGNGIPFYELSADELTPDRIRGTMRYLADVHPRSLVYVDEIDTIAMARDYGGHDAGTRSRLTALLSALDGLLPPAWRAPARVPCA